MVENTGKMVTISSAGRWPMMVYKFAEAAEALESGDGGGRGGEDHH